MCVSNFFVGLSLARGSFGPGERFPRPACWRLERRPKAAGGCELGCPQLTWHSFASRLAALTKLPHLDDKSPHKLWTTTLRKLQNLSRLTVRPRLHCRLSKTELLSSDFLMKYIIVGAYLSRSLFWSPFSWTDTVSRRSRNRKVMLASPLYS